MKTRPLLLLFLSVLLFSPILQGSPAVPGFMGDWEGGYVDPPADSWPGKNPTLVGRVVGQPDGRFRVQILNAFERRAYLELEEDLMPADGVLQYEDSDWEFTVTDEVWIGVRKRKERGGEIVRYPFRLEKVERVSPTLGRPAPEGADVLLEGDELDLWQHRDGSPAIWKLLPDGVMEIVPRRGRNAPGGDLFTKKAYGDCEVHLEFKLPYEPENLGQKRANSGFFLQGNYEVQILDSYGVDSGWTDCGSIYRWSPPKVNRTRPPGQWQTYDIRFRAARFDESGELVEYPRITVLHNGLPIHTDQVIEELPGFTEISRMGAHPEEPLPIFIQDHGHPIQFRNIWVREL